MDPVTATTLIGRPREEVFAYLQDIANHPEFTDHFLVDWRLTREDPVGRGAGARFTIKGAPLQRRFNQADLTFMEVEAPRRIVQAGRGGKFNRIRMRGVYTLEPDGGGTRVEYAMETRPKTISDRLLEKVVSERWWKRKLGRSLRRMRSILEDGEDRGERATIAGR